jgi:hypothetical protein
VLKIRPKLRRIFNELLCVLKIPSALGQNMMPTKVVI